MKTKSNNTGNWWTIKYMVIALLVIASMSKTMAMYDLPNMIYDDPCGILSYEDIRREEEFRQTQAHYANIRSEVHKLVRAGTLYDWKGSVSPLRQLATVICHADYKNSFFGGDKYQHWNDIRLLRDLIRLKTPLQVSDAAVIDEFARCEKSIAIYFMLQDGLVNPHQDISAVGMIGNGKRTGTELNSLIEDNRDLPIDLNITIPASALHDQNQEQVVQRYNPLWAIIGNAIVKDDIKNTAMTRLYLIKILTLCGADPFAPLHEQQYAQPEIRKLLEAEEMEKKKTWSIMDILHKVPCTDQTTEFYHKFIKDIIEQSLVDRQRLIEQGWNGELPVPQQFCEQVFEKNFLDHLNRWLRD